MAEDTEELSRNNEASVLAELALCENLSQTSGWAARWSVELSGADAALLWAPDTVHPIFLCIGAHGEGTKTFLRRSVPRDTGVVHDLLRDRRATVLERSDITLSNDPWLKDLPGTTQAVIAVPLEAEGLVVGLLALIFAAAASDPGHAFAPRRLSAPGVSRARTGSARRAQDRRNAPCDRKAHQPLRPVEGVRVDDRPGRVKRADRPQSGRLWSRGDRVLMDAGRRAGQARRYGDQRKLRCREAARRGRHLARRRSPRRTRERPPQPDSERRPRGRRAAGLPDSLGPGSAT